MASESDALHMSLTNVADLADFMHELHRQLGDRKLKPGEDTRNERSPSNLRFRIAWPETR